MSTPLPAPYPGLRPFEEADGRIFFGRREQIVALLRKLETHRFVAVVGSSGSGKSSLVKAGLLPAIPRKFLLKTDQWERITIRPGRDPYAALEKALRALRPPAAGAVPPVTGDAEFGKILRQTDAGLLKLLPSIIPNAAKNLLLIVDQFEELFAFRRAAPGSEEYASRHACAAFVSLLLASASEPAAKVWVLITMRSDFIGDCEAFLGLPEQVSRSQFLVPRPTAAQMREAIVRPSLLPDEGYQAFTIPEELVSMIINEAGDRPDQLPLMQHALMRTWKFAVRRAQETHCPVLLTADDYAVQAGGIEVALSRHAEEAWAGIAGDPRKSDICRKMFLLLCDVSAEGQIVRRRPKVTEVQAVTKASLEELQEIVRLFQDDDRNFLLPPKGQPLKSTDFLDVSHEALLRQWSTYRKWQESERADVAELRRLVEVAMLRKRSPEAVGLLPAEDLGRLAKWTPRVSLEWARRYVAEEEWNEAQRYLQASAQAVREAEEKRRKEAREKRKLYTTVVVALFALAILSFATAGVTIYSSRKVRDAKKATQNVLARSFTWSIGVSEGDIPAIDEASALWNLARLGPEDIQVRDQLIDHWFSNRVSANRALMRHSQGLHAAVGLSRDLRRRAMAGAATIAGQLKIPPVQSKAALTLPVDPDLALWIEPRAAAELADRLVQSISPLEDSAPVAGPTVKSLAELNDAITWARVPLLVALIERAPGPDGPELMHRVAGALQIGLFNHAVDRTSARDDRLNLRPILRRLEPSDASALCRAIAAALPERSLKVQREDGLTIASHSLSLVVNKLEPQPLDEVSAQIARYLSESIRSRQIVAADCSIASSILETFAGKVTPAAAYSQAGPLAELLVHPSALHDVSWDGWELGGVLAGYAAGLDKEKARDIAKILLPPDPGGNPRQPGTVAAMGQALAALSVRLDESEARDTRDRATQSLLHILDTQGLDTLHAAVLVEALAALARGMSDVDAARVASGLAPVLARAVDATAHDARVEGRFYDSVAALAHWMSPADAARVATALAHWMWPPATDDDPAGPGKVLSYKRDDPGAIDAAFTALAGRFGQDEAQAMGAVLSSALAGNADGTLIWPADPWALSRLASAFAPVARRMPPGEATNRLVARFAWEVAGRLPKISEEMRLSAFPALGGALGRLGLVLPEAPVTRRVALSYLMLAPLPEAPEAGERESLDRRLAIDLSAGFSLQELVDVLQWPICVGEAQKIVLGALETKTGAKFDGDVWKFVDQAPALGIKNLDAPPKRPDIQEAMDELRKIAGPDPVPAPAPASAPASPSTPGTVVAPAPASAPASIKEPDPANAPAEPDRESS